jgi:hypothetical protein
VLPAKYHSSAEAFIGSKLTNITADKTAETAFFNLIYIPPVSVDF